MMQIGNETVATIDFTLKDDAGNVIGTTAGDGSLSYLHGAGVLIPGLERVLNNKQAGDHVQVALPPAEGYGERDESLLQVVARSEFDGHEELEVGSRFRVPAEEDHLVFTVTDISDETVTLDGNHSLAGVTLHFDIHVRDVRVATEQEIAHGHAHGREGHDH